MKERTRFAPSPTGMLHIGGLRTALYAYFLAKQSDGDFILRIEDTDQARSVEGGIENIVETLNRVGIVADEGFTLKGGQLVEVGEKGPYQQSRRLKMYKEAADELVKKKGAYYCFCSKDRLDEVRKQQQKAKQQPKYDRHCLGLAEDEVHSRLQSDEPHVIRLKIPEGKSTIHDIIRGEVVFDYDQIDDQVIIKSDGFPTYHLAVVVDDNAMGITTVIRGEEWLTSTPKHLLLYEMLGFKLPRFAHVPLLLNSDKSKLSKRQGDVAADSYLDRGYLKEALVNFVSTLGYNPKGDQEIYSIEELISLFKLEKVKKSGAVVNFEKLDWMNKQYLKLMDPKELAIAAFPLGKGIYSDQLMRALEIERSRVTTLEDLRNTGESYMMEPLLTDPQILVWKKSDGRSAIRLLGEVRDHIATMTAETVDGIEEYVKQWIQDSGHKTGDVLWPLRVALSGREQSASPFEYIYVIGKEEALKRIDNAIMALQGV